jgi:hypothetical protein
VLPIPVLLIDLGVEAGDDIKRGEPWVVGGVNPLAGRNEVAGANVFEPEWVIAFEPELPDCIG